MSVRTIGQRRTPHAQTLVSFDEGIQSIMLGHGGRWYCSGFGYAAIRR
jgi:hypothetical protein